MTFSVRAQSESFNAIPPDSYQIELIIFKRNTSVSASNELPEYWPNTISMRYPENIMSFDALFDHSQSPEENSQEGQLSGPSTSFQAKKVPFNHLNRAVNRLKRSSRFTVLFDQSWIQTVTSGEKYLPLLIRGGMDYGEFSELSGSIQLERSRFIHLTTNLWHTTMNHSSEAMQLVSIDTLDDTLKGWAWPIPPKSPFEHQLAGTKEKSYEPTEDFDPANAFNVYTAEHTLDIERISILKKKTRVKTNKAAHIDHPLFGVLIKITRVTQ